MKIFRLLLCIFLVINSVTANSQRYNAKPFSIIQITDPQFGYYENNKGYQRETELMEKAVDEINRLHPRFVIFTGDLVNNSNDPAQVNEFKRIVARIDPLIKVLYSPGNHDLGQNPGKKEIAEFRRNFGSPDFSIEYNGTKLIGINSCLIRNMTPALELKQFNWLSRQLKYSKTANHILVFSHYPFFINKPDERDEYFNIPMSIRQKYLDLFKQSKVDAVFSGHYHNNGYGKDETMEMITTSAVGKPLGKAPSGFRIIKVYTDKIENQYYSLDEMPSEIIF